MQEARVVEIDAVFDHWASAATIERVLAQPACRPHLATIVYCVRPFAVCDLCDPTHITCVHVNRCMHAQLHLGVFLDFCRK